MKELYEKVENVKSILNKTKEIKKIKELNQKLKKEHQLLQKITEYKLSPTEEKKTEIITNPLYCEYKKAENEVNFIILKIRTKLKEISNKGMCQK